jgi:hypothetical protein
MDSVRPSACPDLPWKIRGRNRVSARVDRTSTAVSLLFILLGVTGLAHKLMKLVPGSIKAGILRALRSRRWDAYSEMEDICPNILFLSGRLGGRVVCGVFRFV